MFARLFTSTVIIMLVSFLLVGSLFFYWCTRYIMTERREALTTTAQEAARTAMAYSAGSGGEREAWALLMSLDSLGRASSSTILLCDTAGTVAICSGEKLELTFLGEQVEQGLAARVLAEGGYFGMDDLGGLFDEDMYVVGLPAVNDAGETVGIVFVAAASESIFSMRLPLMSSFFLIALVVLGVAFFVTLYVSLRQTRPIDEIAAAADSFANGHLDARVEKAARRQDEMGRLAVSFNAMAESLEQSEKRRQEFVSNVSHELRTPMTTIGGYVDGILDGTIPPEQETRYLTVISDEVHRLSRLVRTLLESSRLQDQVEKQPFAPFDIGEMALQTLLGFEQKIAEKGLEVDLDLPEEPLMVVGNADAIHQVLYNLTDNAVKFANPGGRLGLRARTKGGKVLLTVSNTGETIAPEQQKLIFDRFHKTDASRSRDKEGVGLGLYIVRTILAKHGEEITVESNDGLTEFTFTMTPAQKK